MKRIAHPNLSPSLWTGWIQIRCHVNTSKCKELTFCKKGKKETYPTISNIPQCEAFPILGVIFQHDCRFTSHLKNKLVKANKCLHIIRSLRKVD